MQVRVALVIVLIAICGGPASANDPSASEARSTRPSPKKQSTARVARKDIQDVERFIEENPGAALEMSHLKTLDPDVARVLICSDDESRSVKRKHRVRYYVAVTTTADGEPIESLELRERDIEDTVRLRGNALYLNGIESLTPETANVLAGHMGELHLNGLKALPPEVAAEFANCAGVDSLLSLDGLETLDDESASLLGNSVWALSLKGVKRLSQEAYDKIVQRSGLVADKESAEADAADTKMPPMVWLSPDVRIEKTLGHGPMVSVRSLPPKATFTGYVTHISRISGTAISIDGKALEVLGRDEEKIISIHEWRSIFLGQQEMIPLRRVGLGEARRESSAVRIHGGMGLRSPDVLLPAEAVIVLLLNMLVTDDRRLVVMRSADGIFVMTQDAILQRGKGFELGSDKVRVRAPDGEEALMEICGGTGVMGMGGWMF